jgi:SAM-dependent methyltransferase
VSHVPVESFEELYRAHPDPWSFATSWYEQRRYDVTVACLPQPRYVRAFEPGCAIGELTRRLAARCDELLAIDAAPTAVAQATARCRPLRNVCIRLGQVPADWPSGRFDLVVLSEIGYYFELEALSELRDLATASLEPGGTLLAVHWRGFSDVHVLLGDVVHRCLAEGDGIDHLVGHQEEGFLLDVWVRR